MTIVGNGRLAADCAALESFDLVLMDVQMAEMSGLQADRCLSGTTNARPAGTWSVALTARAMAGDCGSRLAAGMDADVSKPLRSRRVVFRNRRGRDTAARRSSRATAPDGGSRTMHFAELCSLASGGRADSLS